MSVDKRQFFQKATKYIGVHLDRALNFKQPMKKLRLRLHIIYWVLLMRASLVQPGEAVL